MPIVNYVREHIRFIEYAADEHLSSAERLLWYALMHIMNQHAQGNIWPEDFIRISNDRLVSYVPMKYDTVAAARNALKQRGLIDYTPGKKNKQSPAYKINYFYPQYVAPDSESDGYTENSDNLSAKSESIPKKSDYIGGNTGGNMGGNTGGNMGSNIGDIYINNTERETRGEVNVPYPGEIEDEDDEENINARARAEKVWRAAFGRTPTPICIRRILDARRMFGMSEEVIGAAIRRAAFKNALSPTDYVLSLLMDWHKHHIGSLDDVDEYVFLYDENDYEGMERFSRKRESEKQRAARERREESERLRLEAARQEA